MLALVFPPMLHTKSIGWQFFCLWPTHSPTTRRNIPLLYAFLDGSRCSPAFCVASETPEAARRCMQRLGTATLPWSSSWSLRGPRWTRPTTTAVALESFRVVLGVALTRWRKGFVHGQVIFCYALGCWVELVLAVKRSTFMMGWAFWNLGIRDDQTWRGKTWVESRSKHAVAECSMAWSVLWFGSWSQFNFKLK